jgi:hypothetical protein
MGRRRQAWRAAVEVWAPSIAKASPIPRSSSSTCSEGRRGAEESGIIAKRQERRNSLSLKGVGQPQGEVNVIDTYTHLYGVT